MRSVTIIACVLALALYLVTWMTYPFFMNSVFKYLVSFTKEAEITATSPLQQAGIHSLTAISVAVLPILSLVATLTAHKIKKQPANRHWFFKYLFIITLSCFVAAGAKFLNILYLFRQLDSIKLHPMIVNSVSLDQITFYKEVFWVGGIATVMAVLLTKKAK